MAKSNLGLQVWILAIYLLTTGIKDTSSMKLHRDLGITQKFAWHVAHHIRATWQTEDDLLTAQLRRTKPLLEAKKPQAQAQEAKCW